MFSLVLRHLRDKNCGSGRRRASVMTYWTRFSWTFLPTAT